jgi:uncharacterized protein
MGDAETAILHVVPQIGDLPAKDWDACAAGALPQPSNPFITHAFLSALEKSSAASPETGWLPQHLVCKDETGALAACMPCYLKSHSRGEYVFDYGWADAYERAGGRYYPKLLSAVPFTPVTAHRLLVREGPSRTEREELLLRGAIALTERYGASSFHMIFATEQECQQASTLGLLRRNDQQFHWCNEGYASFDDFLATLASRKRKAIRKERREARADGIEMEWVTGADITEAHWDAFFDFYMDTGARKWGRPYLNRKFFSLVSESMAGRILLVLAKNHGRYVAGALNFIGQDTLYGRYWGEIEYHPFLHFETCYYQAIDFAIQHGLKTVEAGAQGAHKLARGYLPVTTHSAHYIADPGLRRAVADFLRRERRAVTLETALLSEESPYRKSSD